MAKQKWAHGQGGYTNHGCRCATCRGAFAAWQRGARARRAAAGLPEGDPRHGTPNGYENYLCRCRPCADAHAAARRDQRRRQRGAA